MEEGDSEKIFSRKRPSDVHLSWLKGQLKAIDNKIPWKPSLNIDGDLKNPLGQKRLLLSVLIADLADKSSQMESPLVGSVKEIMMEGVNKMLEIISVGQSLRNSEITRMEAVAEVGKITMSPFTDYLQSVLDFYSNPSLVVHENIQRLSSVMTDQMEANFYLGARFVLDLAAIALIYAYINKDYIQAKISEMLKSDSQVGKSTLLSPELLEELGKIRKV